MKPDQIHSQNSGDASSRKLINSILDETNKIKNPSSLLQCLF